MGEKRSNHFTKNGIVPKSKISKPSPTSSLANDILAPMKYTNMALSSIDLDYSTTTNMSQFLGTNLIFINLGNE